LISSKPVFARGLKRIISNQIKASNEIINHVAKSCEFSAKKEFRLLLPIDDIVRDNKMSLSERIKEIWRIFHLTPEPTSLASEGAVIEFCKDAQVVARFFSDSIRNEEFFKKLDLQSKILLLQYNQEAWERLLKAGNLNESGKKFLESIFAPYYYCFDAYEAYLVIYPLNHNEKDNPFSRFAFNLAKIRTNNWVLSSPAAILLELMNKQNQAQQLVQESKKETSTKEKFLEELEALEGSYPNEKNITGLIKKIRNPWV
jgi:hypothetical protein